VRVEPAVVQQVVHLGPGQQDGGVGEEAAVAAPPLGLRAHDRGAGLAGEREQPLEPALELLRGHVVGITLELADPPPAVSRVAGRIAPPAELRKVAVYDPALAERPLELGRVEVGHPPRAREAAHIGHRLDPGPPEQVEEGAELVRRVADRENPIYA
jgi:hypothetical protein